MIRALQKRLLDSGIDVAFFFGGDANITYFAGVCPEVGCLAVPASGKPLLFVPGFEAGRMAEGSTVEVFKIERDLIKNVRSRFSGMRVGIVSSSVSYANAKALDADLVDIEQACRELRVVKSRQEISHITKACALTDVLFDEVCSNMAAFKTERDVAAFLKLRMSQFGVEPSFPPIVASGKNASVPHHVPSNDLLKGFTVLDFGVVWKNYCSDITRTVFVGKPSNSDKKEYAALLRVQEECIRQCVSGREFEEIDGFARQLVGASMIHRVGHSLGVEVHDAQPRPLTLSDGMIVTIEPGTYQGKFGIRIEDDVLVTRKAPVLLTKAPKQLISFSR